jgi:alkylation response protein AidB-like acyl-CoA dehydrogenase
MSSADPLRAATDLAEAVLYPAAMSVDAAPAIPAAHLDALAAAGLYGLAGPAEYGGLAAAPATFSRVVETLASGCLATTFVWLQHHGAVRALAASPHDDLRAAWLRPLIQGHQRAGVALVGGWPGPPRLRARPVPGGYELDGTAPWVTGWGMVDVIYTVARAADGNLVAALVPARASASLAAARLGLVAVNAAATVELTFTRHPVPAELVCSVSPHAEWLGRDSRGLRPNGSLALGVAARCCQLAGQPALADQLSAVRDRLDGADAEAMPAARATAAQFAFLAAGAAVTAAGSRGILAGEHPQRLAREAQFLLVFGSRPAIKASLLGLLTGPGTGPFG